MEDREGYERALAQERQLVERCHRLAAELMDAAIELRWYTDDPVGAAIGHLEHVALERGVRPPPPSPEARAKRRRAAINKRAIWDRDGWTCRNCGDHRNLTVDHIIPIIAGGTDDPANLQTLCGSCNSRKGGR